MTNQFLEQYEQMARVYLHEALYRLPMAKGTVHMDFVPCLASNDIANRLVAYSSKDQTIYVSRSGLVSLIPEHKVTVLRFDLYCKARMAYQHIVKHLPQPDIPDAIAFSTALLYTKGVSTPDSPVMSMLGYDEKILTILKNEFGFEVQFKTARPINGDDKERKFIILSQSQEEAMVSELKKPAVSTIHEIPASHSGTKDDPFDNVDDAFEYIERLEETAYENDVRLKEIAKSDYFYDLNYHQFKYPFASPLIAYYENDFPKDSFIVNQNAPHSDGSFFFTMKPNLYRRKFLYRGQNEDYAPKPCVPNLFRDPAKDYFLDDMIWVQEMMLLIQSHPLVKLLHNGVELIHDRFAFLMNVRGLAQHYYHRTSLLDFTSSADVAKFFATTDYDRESDTYRPVAHPDKLGVIYCYELRLPTAFQIQSDGTQLSVIGKQVFMRSGAQHGFLLDMPKDLDMKKMPIVRAVYFRHDRNISDRIFRESDQGKKYFAEDLIEKAWKQEYKQKKEKGIVSADAVRLNVKFNQGETFETICRKLSKYDIKVDSSYSPHFSDYLLADYYNDIKNGWWDEFCQDVYFSGADGCIYKNALLNIQQNPRYRKAFVR